MFAFEFNTSTIGQCKNRWKMGAVTRDDQNDHVKNGYWGGPLSHWSDTYAEGLQRLGQSPGQVARRMQGLSLRVTA